MTKERQFDHYRTFDEPFQSHTPSLDSLPPPIPVGKYEILDVESIKCSWACRHLAEDKYWLRVESLRPRPADVVVVKVDSIGHHHWIETSRERRLRLYKGDRVACVFGNRYATDVYEGLVLDLKKLHLLTGSGLVGTVVSRNRDVGRPTAVSFLGYLTETSGRRVNLKELRFRPVSSGMPPPDVVLVIGTGMSTGKTTITRQVLHSLISHGVQAEGCKLTGSASPRDLYELRATGAVHATDFSDFGFPSTYGASLAELVGLFDSLVDACSRKGSQVVLMEVADGFLQRETQMLLDSEEVRRRVCGVLLAGSCSASALCAVEYVHKAGFDVWAVSGLITNSPLFVREFSSLSPIPVASARAAAGRLTQIVMRRLAMRKPEERNVEVLAQGG